jgi:hypothetical protein
MLFKKLIIALIVSSHVLTCYGAMFTPRVELSAKKGITGKKEFKRDIGRLGAVVPLLQNQNSVGFFTAIGMGDTKKSIEGNFGFGYRYLLNKSYIFGGYAFYDIRGTKNKNILHQTTIGAEFMMENIEIRVNGYIPFNKKTLEDYRLYSIRYDSAINRTLYKKTNNQVVEKGLGGFDIETGGSLPAHNKLSGYVAFYHFAGKGVSSVTGARLRGNYELRSWLSFELESNMDKVRGVTSYLGLNLSWDFGNSVSKKRNPLTRLEMKMTKLPVRDIDIVNGEESIEDEQSSLSIEGVAHLSTEGIDHTNDRIINGTEDVILVGDDLEGLKKSYEGILSQDPLKASKYVGANIILDSNSSGTTKLASDPTIDKSEARLLVDIIRVGLVSKTKKGSEKVLINVVSKLSESDPVKLAGFLREGMLSPLQAYNAPQIDNTLLLEANKINRRQDLINAGIDPTHPLAQPFINGGHGSVESVRAAILQGGRRSEFNGNGLTNAQRAVLDETTYVNGTETIAAARIRADRILAYRTLTSQQQGVLGTDETGFSTGNEDINAARVRTQRILDFRTLTPQQQAVLAELMKSGFSTGNEDIQCCQSSYSTYVLTLAMD